MLNHLLYYSCQWFLFPSFNRYQILPTSMPTRTGRYRRRPRIGMETWRPRIITLTSQDRLTELRLSAMSITSHLPQQTRTFTPKKQKLHQEQSSNTLISTCWLICCLVMVFMYCHPVILYNSINTNYNYTTTCPTFYPSFNPTSYLGQNSIPMSEISSECL